MVRTEKLFQTSNVNFEKFFNKNFKHTFLELISGRLIQVMRHFHGNL